MVKVGQIICLLTGVLVIFYAAILFAGLVEVANGRWNSDCAKILYSTVNAFR